MTSEKVFAESSCLTWQINRMSDRYGDLLRLRTICNLGPRRVFFSKPSGCFTVDPTLRFLFLYNERPAGADGTAAERRQLRYSGPIPPFLAVPNLRGHIAPVIDRVVPNYQCSPVGVRISVLVVDSAL